MTTVTKGAITLTPLLMIDPEYSRESGNIVHKILGRSTPDITLAPALLRTGTHKFLCADRSAAVALEALHTSPGVLTLVDATLDGYGMKYVLANGSLTSAPDAAVRSRWIVQVPFQEVI
jgi:hypothetical protein